MSGADGMDVDAAKRMLLWARSERIALSRVKVGDVEIDVAADLALAPSSPSLANPRPAEDPSAKFGGEALARLREQERQDTPPDAEVHEDDDEPAPDA